MFFSNPEKEYIYELLVDYYDNPDLYKIRNEHEFSLYGIQLPCLLLNEKRFLILLCPQDAVTIGQKRPMRDLRWVSLQSRSLNDPHLSNIPIYGNYQVKRDNRFSLPLKIYHRSAKLSSYRNPEYPVEISLLHLRNNEYEYPNDGSLIAALETYQTIIQWIP